MKKTKIPKTTLPLEPTTVSHPKNEIYFAALISFLLPLLIYVRGLAPGLVIEGDSGEIITVLHEFGILHSPGFPGYVIAAKLFTTILGWLDVAYAANLFSAFSGALCSYWIFRLGRRFGLCWSALCLALTFAFAAEFWYASLATEVYTFALLTLLWVMEALICFDTKKPRSALILGLALGFAFSTHVYAWALLPLVVAVALHACWNVSQRINLIARGLLGFGIGLFPYLYIPLRAGRATFVNEGGIDSFSRFFEHVSWILQRERVEQISKLNLLEWIKIKFEQLVFFAQELILQWRWPGLLLLLFLGFMSLRYFISTQKKFTTQQRRFASVTLGCALFMPLVVWMLFTGDSLSPGLLAEMAVHMMTFYIFLCLFAFVALWKQSDDTRPAAFLVLLPIFLLVQRYDDYDLSKNKIAVAHAEDLIEKLPPQTILFGDNDNDLMTITHQKAVRHQRPDVILLNLMNGTKWNYDNYKKLYPHLRWPQYTPTYYEPLMTLNLEKHPVYFGSWYGADSYLKITRKRDRFDIVPIHGAFRAVEKGQDFLAAVLEDVAIRSDNQHPYQMLSVDYDYHLREREVDVIASRAEYFFYQAQYLKQHQRPQEAKQVITQAFRLPELSKTEYGRAVQENLQKLLNTL